MDQFQEQNVEKKKIKEQKTVCRMIPNCKLQSPKIKLRSHLETDVGQN